uniref:hypothetical protein n=1 Tax=Scytothamnus australis TaxID=66621 RepID=UPI002E75AEBA|nr:hypothetical protein V2495_pgp064 [Scytothamnus australis]WAM64745.1 hypothetical protein [Scytothamnus australis]
MCICLNCDRIKICQIYSIIEQTHGEKQNMKTKIQMKKIFPQSPVLICLNFFSKKSTYLLEWDVNECLSYQEKPGSWLSMNLNLLHTSRYLIFDQLFSPKAL